MDLNSAHLREAEEVELPLLGTEEHHAQDSPQVLQREGSTLQPGRSGIAAGIANMSNSIIGAGIIGKLISRYDPWSGMLLGLISWYSGRKVCL